MAELSLQNLNPSLLHDAIQKNSAEMAARSVISSQLRPAGHKETVTGPAMTLRFRHVGQDCAHGRKKVMESYDGLVAGHILVVEVVGDPGGGVIGDLVAHRLSRIGLLGAIVDGPIRDVSGILETGFLVWSREVTLQGMCADELQVELGVEVSVGGVSVRTGDLVSAGRDGICVVRESDVPLVLEAAEKIIEAEEEAHRRIGAGHTILEAYPTIRQRSVL
jgi:regulator of RNase E activity RraA